MLQKDGILKLHQANKFVDILRENKLEIKARGNFMTRGGSKISSPKMRLILQSLHIAMFTACMYLLSYMDDAMCTPRMRGRLKWRSFIVY